MWEKIKVVELSSVLAGPLVGSFFSELGCTVVKIENKKTNGDVTRTWKLPKENKSKSISAYYAAANYNKKTMFLDLGDKSDYEKVIHEIKSADIVIQNFKASAAQKLKLDGDFLLSMKPDLIIACINGFGEGNKRPAFDVVLQAETGFMFMNGTSTSGPVKMPIALIDVIAAHHLKEAILIALLERSQSSEGKIIQVSLYDAAIASLANQASNWLMEGHIPKALGTQHPNIAPYGDMFETQDGKQIVLAIGNDKQFELFAKLINIEIEKFSNNALRLKHRKELNIEISKKLRVQNSKELMEKFIQQSIPAGLVKNMEEVFLDKMAQKMILEEEMEGQSTKKVKTLLK